MALKIMVVDDEPLFREMMGAFLVGKGYSVVEAHDGDEALAIYKQERPNVVLLDIRMPGKDGLETLRELRAFDPEARVIMVTAIEEEHLDSQAVAEVDKGTLDYITKPLSPESLERTLAILMRMGLIGDDEYLQAQDRLPCNGDPPLGPRPGLDLQEGRDIVLDAVLPLTPLKGRDSPAFGRSRSEKKTPTAPRP